MVPELNRHQPQRWSAAPGKTGSSRLLRQLALLLLLFTAVTTPWNLPGPAAAAEQPAPLTLWIHPYLPATELVKRFAPLARYLGDNLGREVRVRVQHSYQSQIEFVGRDLADLAFMGPAGYVSMRRQFGDKPLLAILEEKGAPVFHGMIIVRDDAALQQLADLKGQSFAFGDPNSTMSSIVPQAMLKQAGVQLSDLGHYDFLNSHHDVALAVLGGFFSAGAVKDEVFRAYRTRGLRALATSPLIPDHLFLTRSNLEPELVAELRRLLLALNGHPAKKEILGEIKDAATGLAPVTAADYHPLAEMMELLPDE